MSSDVWMLYDEREGQPASAQKWCEAFEGGRFERQLNEAAGRLVSCYSQFVKGFLMPTGWRPAA
jgi:hypothetical protein